ncbi:MAG: hypothetical protein NC311_13365 [Muribaculaceae bacterium]|nr:hypothetical protein [Muribaculaceae bacterium]
MPDARDIRTLRAEMARLETELAQAVQDIAGRISQDAGNTKLPGVTPLGPRMNLVRSSELAKGHWTPEYYDAPGQAEYIRSQLSKAGTLSELTRTLERLTGRERDKFHPEILKLLDSALSEIK